MAMRIWHQSFTELARLPAYAEAMKAHAATILRPDTEVVWHGQLPGTYPSNYPGDDIGYGPLYAMHGLQWMAAARAARVAGRLGRASGGSSSEARQLRRPPGSRRGSAPRSPKRQTKVPCPAASAKAWPIRGALASSV